MLSLLLFQGGESEEEDVESSEEEKDDLDLSPGEDPANQDWTQE